MSFYAVLKGRVPGIYTTWDKCKEQTEGFSGPVFRKFFSRTYAEKFMKVDLSKSYPSSSVVKHTQQKEIPNRENMFLFTKRIFNMTSKIFSIPDESLQEVAKAMWEDLNEAAPQEEQETDDDIIQTVLEEYLPVADCFYNEEHTEFLNRQAKTNSYGDYIRQFLEAYRKDGGKNHTGGVSERKVEIEFEDEDEDEEEKDESKLLTDLTDVLYTDGAHNKTTGIEAWGSVVNKHGRDVVEDYQHLFTDMVSKVEDLL